MNEQAETLQFVARVWPGLPAEQRETMRRLAQGQTVKEIARRMNVCPRQVYYWRDNALCQFGARTLAQAMAALGEAGVLQTP